MSHINGEWISCNKDNSFVSTNPANGETLGRVVDGGREHAVLAIDAASKAFKVWSKTTSYERAQILLSCYELMMRDLDKLAELMTLEQGKPIKASRNEVKYGADFFLWFAEEAKRVYGETIPSSRFDQRFVTLKQPVGVVAAITPWNYPISMVTRKLAPALAAGCTVVLKPAEQTPLCAIEVFKLLEEAGLPAGVANLVTAANPVPVGEEFTSNQAVSKLTFTGSTEVGQFLASKAASQMKRISLELGGHAPFIVFEDADPMRAAKGASLVKFLNTGQACISPNRIFVQKSIFDQFTEAFVNLVNKMKAGLGSEQGISIGPLINKKAILKIENQINDAVSKGANLLCGGAKINEPELSGGNFFAPTVLTGINEEMLIWHEETFGPVAAIISFETEDEVLERANDTNYGLASYVYTQNLSRAMRMMEGLRFGIVGINDINPTSAAAPFGGWKMSGIGREGAKVGIEEYLETKLAGISLL